MLHPSKPFLENIRDARKVKRTWAFMPFYHVVMVKFAGTMNKKKWIYAPEAHLFLVATWEMLPLVAFIMELLSDSALLCAKKNSLLI